MDKKLDAKIKKINNLLEAVKKKFTPKNQRKFLRALDEVRVIEELNGLAFTIESEYKKIVIKNLHKALQSLKKQIKRRKKPTLIGFNKGLIVAAKKGTVAKLAAKNAKRRKTKKKSVKRKTVTRKPVKRKVTTRKSVTRKPVRKPRTKKETRKAKKRVPKRTAKRKLRRTHKTKRRTR